MVTILGNSREILVLAFTENRNIYTVSGHGCQVLVIVCISFLPLFVPVSGYYLYKSLVKSLVIACTSFFALSVQISGHQVVCNTFWSFVVLVSGNL